ncbi:MAG: SdpI family protein [Lachnospiraceae bacterium]|nr:SdpI family protein [Lachnospiraceae bacterium]
MWIFILLFVCNLLIPLLMAVIGLISEKHAVRDINGIIGYRTSRSMKNQETWDFAQHYMGKVWKKVGIYLLIISVPVNIVGFSLGENIFSIITAILETVQVIVLLGSIIPVERALKKNFDENGKRR